VGVETREEKNKNRGKMDGRFLEKLTSAESLPVLVAGIALGGLTVGLLLKRYVIFGLYLNITLVIKQQFSPVLFLDKGLQGNEMQDT
jgi:hypothetical protein